MGSKCTILNPLPNEDYSCAKKYLQQNGCENAESNGQIAVVVVILPKLSVPWVRSNHGTDNTKTS